MSEPVEEAKISKIEVKNEGLSAITSNMPDVVPDAVAAAKATDNEIKNAQSDFKDKFGHQFNPQIHDTDEQGNPKITPSGRLKYKAGAKFTRNPASILNLKPAEEKPDPEKAKIQAAAEQFADTFIIAGVQIVGEEWRDKEGERESLVNANYRIFERYGVVEIHPIANVTLVYGLYIFKRVMKPESKTQMIWKMGCKQTGEFFKKIGDWFKYSVFRRPRPVHTKPEVKNAESS